MKDIPDEILNVLSNAELDGQNLRLRGQLDRKTYTNTDKVLKAAGGKWNRSAKAHVFPGGASEAIEPLLLTGQYTATKQDFGQFDTPERLATDVVELANIAPGMSVLEPSAGIGRIARAAMNAGGDLTVIEIDDKRFCTLALALEGVTAYRADFLDHVCESEFDRVVMNPPFAKGADIDHVMHAWKFLKPGGRLVAIVSGSVTFRDDRKYADFRNLIAGVGGEIRNLPDGSFKESGTSVRTALVIADKPINP